MDTAYVYAQTNSQDGNKPLGLIKSDFNTAIDDGLRLAKAPFHFESNDWLTLGAVVGTTALAFAADEDVRGFMQRNHTDFLDKYTVIGRQYGEILNAGIFSGVVYFGGLAAGNSEVRKTGRMLVETLAYAGLVTTVLKSAFGRSRPFLNEGAFRFRGLQFKNENISLPSGHSTVAFAMTSVLASRIKNTYASIGLYSLAAFTAFQRSYDDKHWLSDTILGAAIGQFIGQAIVNYDRKEDSSSSMRLQPSILPYGFAVIIPL
ncbi:MAG: phosphatase PAP2 family protein [Ignavibacteria bacterium]|nr:phosphatase PAP2 family protein [Ignavibacteria bacterium]MCU7504730.1 phosphatase PAP2 family protein [Ignavibacteria bacterium]MCU7516332.1 phosphatase PAP2 family protein [Ignavibacteria bacterium]